MDPYEEGYQACLDGYGIMTNPYDEDSEASVTWEDGWCEAFETSHEDF